MLETLLTYFARYGYLVIFFGVMLENAGVPVPGETILLAALASAGVVTYLTELILDLNLSARINRTQSDRG